MENLHPFENEEQQLDYFFDYKESLHGPTTQQIPEKIRMYAFQIQQQLKMGHQLKVEITANEIHFHYQELRRPSLIEEVLERSQQHLLEAALTYLEPESQDLQYYWNGLMEVQSEEDHQSLWYYYHFGRILEKYREELTDRPSEKSKQVSEYFKEITQEENAPFKIRVSRRAYRLFKTQPALTLYLGSTLSVRKLGRMDQDTFNNLVQRLEQLIEFNFAGAQSFE
jgi:hypothetical protein